MRGETKTGMRVWQKALLCLLVVLSLLVLCGWLWFCHVRSSVTDKEVRELPVVTVSEKERRELLPKYQKFEKGIRYRGGAEVMLEGNDVDKLIATVGRLKRLRGRLSVSLEGDHAWVGVSLPLAQVPLFRNRYLNGRFKVTLEVDGSAVRAQVLEGVNGAGEPYPDWLLRTLNGLLASPEQFEYLAPGVRGYVEHLTIRDGKMYIKVRGKR